MRLGGCVRHLPTEPLPEYEASRTLPHARVEDQLKTGRTRVNMAVVIRLAKLITLAVIINAAV